LRPGAELIARIADLEPRTVVDLGSGSGELTALLASRWPEADVTGVDSSREMVEKARGSHPGAEWVVGDIEDWAPPGPVDLIFSNAALHWVDDHHKLFRGLRSHLSSQGALAVQMPDNWRAPTHRVPADILDEGDWPEAARRALLRDRVCRVDDYREWLQPAEVDVWRTTYHHTLTGDDPVWAWVTGSLLRPVLAALDDDDSDRFEAECKSGYAAAYPTRDGVTTLPFSRLFLVARPG